MPGNQVKNWPQYESLRKQGFSKESSARITNASAAKSSQPSKEAIGRRIKSK